MISVIKNSGIRVSIFVGPVIEMVKSATETGTDRIELYTEKFTGEFEKGERKAAISPYNRSSKISERIRAWIKCPATIWI